MSLVSAEGRNFHRAYLVAYTTRKKHASRTAGRVRHESRRTTPSRNHSSFTRFHHEAPSSSSPQHARSACRDTTVRCKFPHLIYTAAARGGRHLRPTERRGKHRALTYASRVAKPKCPPYATDSHTRCTSSPCSANLARAPRTLELLGVTGAPSATVAANVLT
jgi:hypothetical protein